jgi:hypothetical protein
VQNQRIKQRLHRVIIDLRNGVELVIVAFGASDRHAHESSGNRVHRVDGQVLRMSSRPPGEKPKREGITRPRLFSRSIAGRRHLGPLVGSAAGQLNLHELVVGQIIVQGIDHPVAPQIHPRRRDQPLIRVTVSQDIKPVPRIANRVLFVVQQPIHDLLVRVW